MTEKRLICFVFFSLREKTKESKILGLEHSELFAAKYYKTEKHLLAKDRDYLTTEKQETQKIREKKDLEKERSHSIGLK